MGRIILYIMEHKKCLKPPTRIICIYIYIYTVWDIVYSHHINPHRKSSAMRLPRWPSRVPNPKCHRLARSPRCCRAGLPEQVSGQESQKLQQKCGSKPAKNSYFTSKNDDFSHDLSSQNGDSPDKNDVLYNQRKYQDPASKNWDLYVMNKSKSGVQEGLPTKVIWFITK